MIRDATELYDKWAPVYKYRAINRYSLSILLDGELYFASPEHLNDPHDCQIDVAAALEDALEKYIVKNYPPDELFRVEKVMEEIKISRSAVVNTIRKAIAHQAICSFSIVPDHALMWSHYSNAHRGFCLGFDPEQIRESIDGAFDNVVPQPVLYIDENPLISALHSFFDLSFASISKRDYPSLGMFCLFAAQSVMRTKSLFWAYEKEFRFIRVDRGCGPVKYPPTALLEVIFGCNINDHDRWTLLNILKAPEWKHVRLRKVKKSLTSYSFEIVDI